MQDKLFIRILNNQTYFPTTYPLSATTSHDSFFSVGFCLACFWCLFLEGNCFRRWTGYSTLLGQLTALWNWPHGLVSDRLKRNFLCSKEHNLTLNKILKQNKCLKARKKKSLPRISCLFNVFPQRLKTLQMFLLNEPLLCLVCKDPWSPEGWNQGGCFSQRKQMFRGQYKNNLFLSSFSFSSEHQAKKESTQGCQTFGKCPAEAPPCRCIPFVLWLHEGKERENWVHFKNLRRMHLPVSVQIPLIAHMFMSSLHYLPTNSSPKYTHKIELGSFCDDGY